MTTRYVRTLIGLRRALRHRSKTASVPLNMASVAKYARGPNAVIRLPASRGPMAAAPPFNSSSVLLDATICAGSSLSLTCDTDKE